MAMRQSGFVGANAVNGDWARKDSDFYPTPPDCTQAVFNWHRQRLAGKRVLEPCCGEGHIARALAVNGLEVTSSDLFDRGWGTPGVDYLTTPMKADAIITNPPFSLAMDFLMKAVDEAPFVAFLLKQTFWNASSRHDWFIQNLPAFIHPLTWRPVFAAERGEQPLMDVMWCVWIPGEHHGYFRPMSKPAWWPRLEVEHDLHRLDTALTAWSNALAG